MDNCFAWVKNTNGLWYCKALDKTCNGRNNRCSFYKTPEKHLADRKKAFERIAKMESYMQVAISDKYYKNERPWENYANDKQE